MANDNLVYGFVPWGPLLRTKWAPVVAAAGGNPVFIGDVVHSLDSGYVSGSTDTPPTWCTGASLTFLTGAVAGSISIASDPQQYFHCQTSSGAVATLTLAYVGLNADSLYAAGSVYTKRSGTTLNTQTVAVAATTAQFRLEGLRDNINSDGTRNAYGAYNKVIVSPVEHMNMTTTGV